MLAMHLRVKNATVARVSCVFRTALAASYS